MLQLMLSMYFVRSVGWWRRGGRAWSASSLQGRRRSASVPSRSYTINLGDGSDGKIPARLLPGHHTLWG